MAKYRKTSLVEAVKTFAGDDGYADWFIEDAPWMQEYLKKGIIFRSDGSFKIQLREGVVTLNPGSWIVRGSNGDIWPVDSKVFEDSYEWVK